MGLKKLFTSSDNNSKKKYIKSKRTFKIKKKMKKLKNTIEEEAKNTIDTSKRKNSVYTPLEDDNMEIETPVVQNSTKIKSKKRKSISIETESNELPEMSTTKTVDEIVKKNKQKKNKKNKTKNDEKSFDAQNQLVKNQKKNEIVQNDNELHNDLDASASDLLLPETESNRDSRTVYVGNLPVNFKKKKLLKILKQYGNVEKMWTRGAKPLATLPKKIAINKRMLPEDHPPLMVHALFKSIDEAHRALGLNGESYDGHRLRVTLSQEKIFDSRKGVFVGNLPFNVKDDDLFNLFEQCGEIVSVRVIRDNKYGTGKGFGYVNFKTVDSVEFALNLNEEKINGRLIRVQRLFTPGKKKKMDKKKEHSLLKTDSKNKVSFPIKKSKSGISEKRPKKKTKLKLTDLKKKILVEKLTSKSKTANSSEH